MPRRGRTDEGRSTIAAARLAAIVAPSASRALPSDEVESARENGRHEAASAARRPPAAAEIGQPQGSVDHLDVAGVRFTELAFAFGRRHFGVLAVLLALGLVLTGWMFLRARPVADASPLAVATTVRPSATQQPSTTRSATPTQPPVLVHVLGAVRRSGVVSLPPGSRVRDALKGAGGLRADARPGQLNLARILSDGEQIVVGSAANPGSEVRDGTGSDAASSAHTGTGPANGEVNLNSATEAQLDQLPGVGPVTAQRILSWRSEHGRFSRIEELQEVEGIGPKTYARIAPHVRV